jgi:AAA domain-containing protein
VIHGPPGTGKSQTIANLIAALVARGRKVLFVAEKRAAIDAVLTRLNGAGLGEVVLDIHDGTRDRQRIAADLGAALDRAARTPLPDVEGLHRRLVDRQQRLTQHVSALHQVHRPATAPCRRGWGRPSRSGNRPARSSGPRPAEESLSQVNQRA